MGGQHERGSGQAMLWAPVPAESATREYRAGGRTLRARADVFDTFWRFAAERQAIFHRRAAGLPPPWTTDRVLSGRKFTNVYRAADRGSQDLINSVIYHPAAPASPRDQVFRVLLYKTFNTVRTWRLLEAETGPVSWAAYSYRGYDRVLTAALSRREAIYSPAYIIPDPPFGEARKHRNHLRLLEHMMTSGLAETVAGAGDLGAAYHAMCAYPSIGPFLGFQFAVDLAYAPVLAGDERSFVVPGPGALDGIAKCFEDTGGLASADIIRWIADTAPAHFAERALGFTGLWGRAPTLVDWQNVFCEVAKFTRATHPDVRGTTGRTRIKQAFAPAARPVSCRFPPKWGLPPERTAISGTADAR
jgi:hypothetical protein